MDDDHIHSLIGTVDRGRESVSIRRCLSDDCNIRVDRHACEHVLIVDEVLHIIGIGIDRGLASVSPRAASARLIALGRL